jgi:hypothetical protein
MSTVTAWQVIGGSMRVFVFGDSFAATPTGWARMLDGEVSNFAQNGIGEYKIYKGLQTFLNFDKAVICHTSPWRVHTRVHPVHKNNPTRFNNDFMLNDVEYHSATNKDMKVVREYLENYYDPEYQEDTYRLFVNELMKIPNTIHITFHEPDDTKQITHNFNKIYKKHPGEINHMSEEGNKIIAEKVQALL